MPNAVIDAYKEQINQLIRRRDDAQLRLQAVTKTADEIHATIQSMDELLLSLQEFVHREADESQKSAIQAAPGPRDDSLTAPKKRATGNSKKEEVARAARSLIEDAGRPLSRAELYPLLVRQRLKIEGSNAEMVLSTMLWRAGEAAGIVRLKSGGYDLAERHPDFLKREQSATSDQFEDLLGDAKTSGSRSNVFD